MSCRTQVVEFYTSVGIGLLMVSLWNTKDGCRYSQVAEYWQYCHIFHCL